MCAVAFDTRHSFGSRWDSMEMVPEVDHPQRPPLTRTRVLPRGQGCHISQPGTIADDCLCQSIAGLQWWWIACTLLSETRYARNVVEVWAKGFGGWASRSETCLKMDPRVLGSELAPKGCTLTQTSMQIRNAIGLNESMLNYFEISHLLKLKSRMLMFDV